MAERLAAERPLSPAFLRRALRFFVCAFSFCVALSITAAEWGSFLALACLLVLAWKEGLRPRLTPMLGFLAAYALAGALASLFAAHPERAAHAMLTDFQKVLTVLIVGWAFSVERNPQALAWYGAGLAVSALVGFFQVAAWHFYESRNALQTLWFRDLQWYHPYLRAHGSIHPVTYGEQMGLGFLGGLAGLMLPSKDLPRRGLLGAWTGLIGAALLLSQTRGAWLGVFAGVALLAWLKPSGLRQAVLPVLAAGLILIIPFRSLGRSIAARAGTSVDPHYESNAIRLTLWRTALDMGRDHPFVGVGPGNFRTSFTGYHPDMVGGQTDWGDAHNQYLQALAERGGIGLAALLAAFAAFLALSLRNFRRSPDGLTLWAPAAVLALAVMNLTESAFHISMAWLPFVFIWSWADARAAKERHA